LLLRSFCTTENAGFENRSDQHRQRNDHKCNQLSGLEEEGEPAGVVITKKVDHCIACCAELGCWNAVLYAYVLPVLYGALGYGGGGQLGCVSLDHRHGNVNDGTHHLDRLVERNRLARSCGYWVGGHDCYRLIVFEGC
jgi:hypothetical protein